MSIRKSRNNMKNYLIRLFNWIFRGIPITHVIAQVNVVEHKNRLKGKKVLITGGGRGLGFYMAKKLLAEGAEVVIIGRNEEILKKASIELSNCAYIAYDLCNYKDYPLLIEKANKLVDGGLNCLINNAGISLHEHDFVSVSESNFDDQFNTNIKSPYFLTQEFIKNAQKKGYKDLNVLFITSERGLYGDTLPYGLTKASINSLTKGLSSFYVNKGVRVNAIAPGVTASDMVKVDKNGDLYRANVCCKRVLIPEEIAEVVAFAISEESGCITGEIFPCNKGNHLRTDYN